MELWNHTFVNQRPHPHGGWRSRSGCVSSAGAGLIATLCVGLLLIAASLQVCHDHPNSANPANDSCSMCSLAHSGIQSVAVFQAVSNRLTSSQVVIPIERLVSEALLPASRIRPPPAA